MNKKNKTYKRYKYFSSSEKKRNSCTFYKFRVFVYIIVSVVK